MDDGSPAAPAEEANRIEVEHLADRIDAIIDSRIRAQTKTLAVLFFAQALIVAGLSFAAGRLA